MHSLNNRNTRMKSMKKCLKKLKTRRGIGRECSNEADRKESFFWRLFKALSIFALLLFLLIVLSHGEDKEGSSTDSAKQMNFIVSVLAFVLTFVMQGIFQRNELDKSSVFWSLVLYAGVIYELVLIFLLFQSVSYARELLTYIDPNLNKPIDYKSYGGSCTIWDSDHPDGPLHNVMDKMDEFVISHLLGWLLKALCLRDFWMTHVFSFVFELLEYTFEHQLPNFSECWWDHWLLDFLFCNGLGIFIGLKLAKHWSWKERCWFNLDDESQNRNLRKKWEIEDQCRNWRWIEFRWKSKDHFAKGIFILLFLFFMLVFDLNTFYLKFILWLHPNHPIVIIRIAFVAILAIKSLTQAYQFLTNEKKYLGQHVRLVHFITATEIVLIVKYDSQLILLPPPMYITLSWLLFLFLLLFFWLFKINFTMPSWLMNVLKNRKFENSKSSDFEDKEHLSDVKLEFRNNARKRINLLKI